MPRETLIQMRQGNASAWASNNPVLAAGEFAVLADVNLIKVGDGATAINDLGYFANTEYANVFRVGQHVWVDKTSAAALRVTSGMRFALITTATTNVGGASITYTYATNGSGLTGGLLAIGDYVTIVGFENTAYNKTNVIVTNVTTGATPTFTVGTTSGLAGTVTGNSNTWFYETQEIISDLLRVNTTGPGVSPGTSAHSTAFKITGNGGAYFYNGINLDGNLSIVGLVASDITFSGTSLGIRLNSSATYTSTSRITGTSTTSTSGTAMLESKAPSTSTNYHQFFSDTSGIIGRVRTASGTIYFENVSDYRLKENVVLIDDAVEKVKALKPSRFNFKHVPETTIDGFIAHEVAEVVPMAVSGEKDGVDEDGNPDYQSLDASKLIPVLTAALQDALLRIEALEKKVK
jgi:hypothetical protein